MKFFIVLSMLLISKAAQGQSASALPQASLLFTPQETRDAEMLAEKTLPAGSSDIHLGAVMFYGKDDWTLWLQNQRWTPQTSSDNLRVIEVAADHVQIAWRDDNGAERQIELRPNQTYELATGRIIP